MISERIAETAEKIKPVEECINSNLKSFFESKTRRMIVCSGTAVLLLPLCIWMLFRPYLYQQWYFGCLNILMAFLLIMSLGELAASAGRKISLKRYVAAGVITAVVLIVLTPIFALRTRVDNSADEIARVVAGGIADGLLIVAPALTGALLLGRFVFHKKA